MQNFFMQPPIVSHDHVLYFDGSAIPNPGQGGCGFVIKNFAEVTVYEEGKLVHLEGQGNVTSNQAEYAGLIEGLRKCRELGSQILLVRGDSELVIKQMLHYYAVTSPNLIPLNRMAQEALQGFIEVRFEVIPRDLNYEADTLSRKFLSNSSDERPHGQQNRRRFDGDGQQGNKDSKDKFQRSENFGNRKKFDKAFENKGKDRKNYRNYKERNQDSKNFTMDWLDALQDDDIEYITQLIEMLGVLPDEDKNLPPKLPPALKNNSLNTEGSQNNQRRKTNRRNTRNQSGVDDSQSLQVRYLKVMASCNLSEAFRSHAFEYQKGRQWSDVALAWNSAYETINGAMIESDRAFAIFIASQDGNESAVDLEGHDLKQLEVIFKAMEVLRDDTERERVKALEKMNDQLNIIITQLTPLRTDRDAIKQRLGEEKWKNNPNPKMDYAQRIIHLHRERVSLEKAIELVQQLVMIAR